MTGEAGNRSYLYQQGSSAVGERRELLEAYGMGQRVRMPMHQPPRRSVPAKDPGHPERPVLVRQTTDLAMLPFDQVDVEQARAKTSLPGRQASPLKGFH